MQLLPENIAKTTQWQKSALLLCSTVAASAVTDTHTLSHKMSTAALAHALRLKYTSTHIKCNRSTSAVIATLYSLINGNLSPNLQV